MKKTLLALTIFTLTTITYAYMSSSSIPGSLLGIVASFTGATTGVQGSAGSVPVPAAGKQTSFLRGDATFASAATIGSGSPNTVVTGQPGDIYVDSVASLLYTKLTGANTNTGWSAATSLSVATLVNYVNQNTTWTSSSPLSSTAYVNVATLTTVTVGKTGNSLLVTFITPPVSQTGGFLGDYILALSIDAGSAIPITSINTAAVTNNGNGMRLNGTYLFTGLTAGSHTINFQHKTTTSNPTFVANMNGAVDRPFTVTVNELSATQ